MKKRILVAEDEKPIARALTLKLKKAGFDVFTAFDGQQTLDILEKNKIDLILLDLIMPVIDGFTVLEEINKKKIKVKIFITSNLGQQSDIDKAEKLGVTDFFVKANVSIAEIIKKVEDVFK